MAKTIFLDTETTGIEETDRMIQLGMLVVDDVTGVVEVYEEYFNPGVEITIRAMETHNIVPAVLEGKGQFVGSELEKKLNELNIVDNTMVIHNAPFDLKMLAKEGFELKMKLIDTLRVAKHIYPNAEFHRLQYLRYSLGLYKIEKEEAEKLGIELKSHDATGDCLFLKNLLVRMTEDVVSAKLNKQPMDVMIELTTTPVMVSVIPFGKHKGKQLVEVAVIDPSWLRWALNNIEDMDADLRYSIAKVL